MVIQTDNKVTPCEPRTPHWNELYGCDVQRHFPDGHLDRGRICHLSYEEGKLTITRRWAATFYSPRTGWEYRAATEAEEEQDEFTLDLSLSLQETTFDRLVLKSPEVDVVIFKNPAACMLHPAPRPMIYVYDPLCD